ncbi:MAG TPA: zf-HC2 domain-containing protein [Ktedonobacterales bacterium]|nr:zf-HC2 domain-containing protein [Ktedonobacterales bacterium]
MTCSRAQHLLQLYIDHRLSLAHTRALERHLLHCSTCRAEWMLLEDVLAGIHSLNNIVEPAWLTESIMARVAEMTAQPPAEQSIETRRLRQRTSQRTPFRLTVQDVILSSLLATVVVISFALVQPGLRDMLVKSVNSLLGTVLAGLQFLISPNAGIMGLFVWMLWVFLGICITLVLAGSEVRSHWRQRIRGWLPQGWR